MAIHVISDAVVVLPRISSSTGPSTIVRGWAARKVAMPAPPPRVLKAMAPVIATGKWIGCFAFRGLANPRFQWASPRVAHLAVTAVGMALPLLMALVPTEYDEATTSIKFLTGANGVMIHAGVSFTLMLLFVRVGAHWPAVAGALKRLESRLARRDYTTVNLGPRIRCVTIALLLTNLVIEILVDAVPYCLEVVREARFQGSAEFIRELFLTTFPPFRNFPSAYSTALALWSFVLRVQTKYLVVYSDLLLGTLGCALAALFAAVKERVRCGDFKAMTDRDWQDIRETYNEVLDVTAVVNHLLGPVILISYTSGLWFVCGGILLLLAGGETEPWKQVYLFLSMSFWSARLVLTTIAMATVSEQNEALRRHLHAVPTALCGCEVSRLTVQACHGEVAGLTGMDFFTVSRSVLLTLVGTVASYEIVLMQFSR